MSVRIIRGTLRDPKVARSLRRILEATRLCSMATVAPGGGAHINTAYFAFSPALEFWFYSYLDAGHSLNLERNPTMALAIFESGQVWGQPDRGLQLFGTCRPVVGRGAEAARRSYGRRFPEFLTHQSQLPPGDGGKGLRPYRFVPKRAKLFDERTFGAGTFVHVSIPRVAAGSTLRPAGASPN